MRYRFALLIGSLLVSYSLLIFHLYDIQIVRGGNFLAKAESQSFSASLLKAQRGSIYFTDKNGNRILAATNKNFPTVYAVPKAIGDPIEAAHQLSGVLGKPEPDLEKALGRVNDSYELLLRKADPEVAKRAEELKIKGVYVDSVPERYYPFGNLASQILGYVGPNAKDFGEQGHYGLEEYYDSFLSGQPGEIKGDKIISPRPGRDLTLTIDPNIEKEGEWILDNLIRDHKAVGGSVIVMEPKTGKILALGNLPSFDPNDYGQADLKDLLNPAIQRIYEPGSVFKVITMAAGIDSGKITPETTYVDAGSLTLNGRTITNYDLKTHGAWGLSTMTNVIEHSINTGAVFAERETGRDIFKNYVAKFGFGEKTGITLPAEIKGNISRLSPKERDIAFATASYGQGIAVTPLEVIRAIAAIGNGGDLATPYLLSDFTPKILRKVISADTATKVSNMMLSAVDKAGVAKIMGYTLAGKTGTAFVPNFQTGGYTDQVINTYVGFGPYRDPRFIALIKLDKPEGGPLSALTVVPAFRDLAQFILNYYNVPPDRL